MHTTQIHITYLNDDIAQSAQYKVRKQKYGSFFKCN